VQAPNLESDGGAPSLLRRFAARASRSAGFRLTHLSQRLAPPPPPPQPEENERSLYGERDVEWAWCLAHLRSEPGRVLDFGTGNGFLSLTAAFRGHDVVAVDLEPSQFEFRDARIDYRRGDFNEMEFAPGSFDQILNCSSIEHVGLEGRYGSRDEADGDLLAMSTMAGLLAPGGTMALAVPVGLDATYTPWHRVYGAERLPRLLDRFTVLAESYWAKLDVRLWEPVDRQRGLAERGSATYYALGLFLLEPR
jgi:SAM-dependent methyltransferase